MSDALILYGYDYLFFVYGLAFVFIGAVAVAISRMPSDRAIFRSLALFAFTYGLMVWFEMSAWLLPKGISATLPVVLLEVLAFISLLHLLRSHGSLPLRLHVVFMAGIVGAAALIPRDVVALAPLLLGGAIIVSAFIVVRKIPGARKGSGPAYAMMILGALHFINEEAFLNIAHVPLQTIQVICSVYVLGYMWSLYQERLAATLGVSPGEVHSLSGRWVAPAIAMILLMGYAASNWVQGAEDESQRKSLLTGARIALGGIDYADVASLTGTPRDLTSAEYRRLKQKMITLRAADPSSRFVYLMAYKDGKVFFMVDSEPPSSEDYSPPGQVYPDASDDLTSMFSSGKALVEGPLPDDWGVWVSALTPLKDPETGKVIAVLGTDIDAANWIRDISEHRQFFIAITTVLLILIISIFVHQHRSEISHIRVSASEQRLRKLFDVTYDALVLHDLDGNISNVNGTMLELFGLTREQALRLKLADLFVPESIDRPLNSLLRGAMDGADPVFEGQARRPQDGGVLDVMVAVRSFSDDASDAILTCIHDITKRKQAEAAKSSFLANVSHEIRTPMNAVIGMSDLLLDTKLTREQAEYANVVRASGEHLLFLINDLLDFSKIEAGGMKLDEMEFDLFHLLEETIDLLALQSHKKGIPLVSVIHPETPVMVKGDPGRLRQILLNLGTNAVKFTERGEITITVEPVVTAPMAVAARAQKLLFTVTDTGIGIPEERTDELFTPFSQADAHTRSLYGGWGLGLSIAKRLTEMMGGRIGARRRPEGGSVFWFDAALPKSESALADVFDSTDLAGKRVLIVDSHPVRRRNLESALAQVEVEFDTCEDISRAVDFSSKTGKEPYHAILVDTEAVDEQSHNLIHRLRSSFSGRQTRLIAMVMLGESVDPRTLEAAGYSTWITRPVKRAQLYNALGADDPERKYEDEIGGAEQVAAPHLRLLLVEDNKTNQLVAVRHLEKLGYEVEVADNGPDALDALATREFSAVLLDCQMPGMDGFEVSEAVRDPGSRVLNHQIPIIAMTAHSADDYLDKCLAAGMNDFVSKPIDKQLLPRTLEKWIGAVFDRADLMERLDDDMSLAAQVIEVFISDFRERMALLTEAVKSGDCDTARREAHTIRGAAGNAGAKSVHLLAERFEKACGDPTLSSDDLSHLACEMESQFILFTESSAVTIKSADENERNLSAEAV